MRLASIAVLCALAMPANAHVQGNLSTFTFDGGTASALIPLRQSTGTIFIACSISKYTVQFNFNTADRVTYIHYPSSIRLVGADLDMSFRGGSNSPSSIIISNIGEGRAGLLKIIQFLRGNASYRVELRTPKMVFSTQVTEVQSMTVPMSMLRRTDALARLDATCSRWWK